jgi:hypothetical protein
MEFEVKGHLYDTKGMDAFPTGQPTIPAIYIFQRSEYFIETARARWTSPRIKPIDYCEARRLAFAYGLRELQQALADRPRQDAKSYLCCGAEVLQSAGMTQYPLGSPARAILFFSRADNRCFFTEEGAAISAKIHVTEISTDEAAKLAETFGASGLPLEFAQK